MIALEHTKCKIQSILIGPDYLKKLNLFHQYVDIHLEHMKPNHTFPTINFVGTIYFLVLFLPFSICAKNESDSNSSSKIKKTINVADSSESNAKPSKQQSTSKKPPSKTGHSKPGNSKKITPQKNSSPRQVTSKKAAEIPKNALSNSPSKKNDKKSSQADGKQKEMVRPSVTSFDEKSQPTPKIVPYIAEVNGEKINAFAFEQLLVDQLQTGAVDSVELRKTIRNELVVQTILSQQSMKDELDQLPEFDKSMESARRIILSKIWRRKWLEANAVEEKAISMEYNSTIKRLGETEFRIRQVVLKDKTAADLILVQIEDGKEMAELASKYSVEFKGKENKGLLPWVSPSVLLPPIGEKIKNAKAGDLLETPIKTEVGWHVVRIEGVRPLVAPTYEKLKPELKVLLSEKRLNQAIQKLVNESKVQF